VLLEDLYGDAARDLPSDEDADEALLTADNVPRPVAHMTTGSVRIFADHHYMWAATIDMLKLAADAATFRQLGLLCLGVLLHHEVDGVDLELTAAGSHAKLLRVELVRHAGLRAVESEEYLLGRPVALRYFWSDLFPADHPWPPHNEWWKGDKDANKPNIELLDSEGGGAEGNTIRDRVIGFGNDHGLAKMATLFLDFGAAQGRDSCYLFGDDMAQYSAELALGLPGTDWSSI
jgi:hypothetical protein